jgi:predicted nucleic acid-binding protein
VNSRAIADTSIFIANETGRPLNTETLPDELAVSVITIGELRAGVLAATDLTTRDRRLRTLTAALELDPVPIDTSVAEHWAKLRVTLRDRGLRMGVNDSWIAATALALDVPVLTQDDGFPTLDELRVLHAYAGATRPAEVTVPEMRRPAQGSVLGRVGSIVPVAAVRRPSRGGPIRPSARQR